MALAMQMAMLLALNVATARVWPMPSTLANGSSVRRRRRRVAERLERRLLHRTVWLAHWTVRASAGTAREGV